MACLSYSSSWTQHWVSQLHCNHTNNAVLSFHSEHANCILYNFQQNFTNFKCTCCCLQEQHWENVLHPKKIKKKKIKCHGRYILHISVERAPASLVSQYKYYTEGLSDCSLSPHFSLFVAISHLFVMMWIRELTNTCMSSPCLFCCI